VKVAIHNASRVWGGNEKWLTLLSSGLVQRGHAVTVACARGPVAAELRERDIGVTHAAPLGSYDLVRALAFRAWLRRTQPDVIVLTSWKTTPICVRAAIAAGVPRIISRLGVARPLPTGGALSKAFRQQIDAVIVNSSDIRDVLLGSAPGFPQDKVHVVMNGVPLSENQNRVDVRRSIGVPADALLITAAGSLTQRKGFDVLISAFARAAISESHLLIAGSGEERSSLRSLAESHGIANRVHMPGTIADVPSIIGASDIFVLSSRNEGMANVMLESMAVGTPVVATAVSGVSEALGDTGGKAAGWIVPVDDVESMAATLREVAELMGSDPNSVEARTSVARERIRARFGVDRMVEEVERILRGDEVAG
jgi:glycosyltransferase involved in cell wall biosynthesis